MSHRGRLVRWWCRERGIVLQRIPHYMGQSRAHFWRLLDGDRQGTVPEWHQVAGHAGMLAEWLHSEASAQEALACLQGLRPAA